MFEHLALVSLRIADLFDAGLVRQIRVGVGARDTDITPPPPHSLAIHP